MRNLGRILLLACLALLAATDAARAAEKPDCARRFSLALHDHGLLYSNQTGEGVDKDFADELIRRSGCTVDVTLMARARIWQLIESGALDFSLSGISNEARERFVGFAWYFSNKYYLLLRKDAGVRSLDGFEAARGLRLGATRGFRYGPRANRLVDKLDAQGRVSYANSLDSLYETLRGNSTQAMIIEPFDYPAAQSANLREQTAIFEFDDPAVPHGLIMSKASLAPAQQQAWRALVEGMRSDGTVRRIFEKYFKPDLARALTQF